MVKFKKFIFIGLIISFIIHTLLIVALIKLSKTKKTLPPETSLRKPEIVDIITLPKPKKIAKNKEKHKVASNISRKSKSKIFSRKEKLPFGSRNLKIGHSKPHTLSLPKAKTKLSKRSPIKKHKNSKITQKLKTKNLKIYKKPISKKSKPAKSTVVKIRGGLFKNLPETGFITGKSYKYKSTNAKKEATVSIGTQSIKYASYLEHIKNKIQNVWIYPQEAIQTGQQGRLLILFSIGKNGSLVKIKLIRSSGYPLLDNAALQAVKDAAPFPPLPKRFGVDILNIYATFEYTLGYYFIY